MAHDLVVRNGLVVDGLGAEPVAADIGIDGDRIVAVGAVAERGRRELDADGRLVAPGFVDIHTHLDAQLGWDPLATSSCWHGVTSVVLGSCGVTFAPYQPEDRRYLAELMESVEDVPADSIMAGLDWGLGDLRRLPRRRRVVAEGPERRRDGRPLRGPLSRDG